MTEQAAQAKRLFDGEKWGDAALALYRVYKGETGDDEGNKQLAQYHLAIALYRLKFYQAAYGIFSEIADKPNHLKFNETLLWLAKLATDLPEPADIVERVGKYNDAADREVQQPEPARALLAAQLPARSLQVPQPPVRRGAPPLRARSSRESKYYVQGQFFSGISQRAAAQDRSRRSQSFQTHRRARSTRASRASRTRRACATSRSSRWRARTTRRRFASTRTTRRRSTRRSSRAAVKYWNKVDVGSEYWLDGLFEESWAYFMAGDYAHALGNIHTIESPYFPNSYYPEADSPQGRHLLRELPVRRRDDHRRASSSRSTSRSTTSSNKVLDALQGRRPGRAVLQVPEGRARRARRNLPPATSSRSSRTRSPIASCSATSSTCRSSTTRASASRRRPTSFRDSPLGNDVKDALQLARDIAVRNAGQLARERYQRNLDELNEHLRDSAKILIDITAAQAQPARPAIAGCQVTARESEARTS